MWPQEFSFAKLIAEAQMGREMLIRTAWDKSCLSTVSPPLQDTSLSVNHFRMSRSMSVSHRQHPEAVLVTLCLT